MNKRILIIEDEVILLRVLKDKFEQEGWSVDTAENGDEAIEKVKKDKFKLLLLDLLMPKLDGFEVIKIVRTDKHMKNVPIIVMSNLGDEESIARAMTLGANEYFVKNQHPIREIIEKAESMVLEN